MGCAWGPACQILTAVIVVATGTSATVQLRDSRIDLLSQSAIISPPASPSSDYTLGDITQNYSLRPYLKNGADLPPNSVLQNLTVRCIGKNLYDATAPFRKVLNSTLVSVVEGDNLTLRYSYWRGVSAPLEGSRRKLLLVPAPASSPSVYGQRLNLFMSIDTEVLALGGPNSSIIAITLPGQLLGYLAVELAQHFIQVQCTLLNMSTTSVLQPIVRQMNAPPIYVLGTILKVTGQDLIPVSTQTQNMLYIAFISVFGSQNNFLYNRIGAVYEVREGGQDVALFSLFTYTNRFVASINELANGDLGSLLDPVASSAGANLTFTVLNSTALGTQLDELDGAPQFQLNFTKSTLAKAGQNSGLSAKERGGIIAGSIGGLVLAVLLIAIACHGNVGLALHAVWCHKRLRKRPGQSNSLSQVEPTPLRSPLTGGASLSVGSSSGLVELSSSRASDLKALHFSPDHSGAPSGSETGETTSTSPLLQMDRAWTIDPSELAVCQLSDGSDWLLGTGSFGQVYRGLRGGVQDVAIKQLTKPGDLHLRMFEKEVNLLRNLNFDKNVVQFYGACTSEVSLMLVLEYMAGGDLKEALGNDPFGEFGWHRKGGRVLMDVARGLHFLHMHQVAHRDLKTKNILLTETGEAKIADVGLAKLVGSQLLSTQVDTAGTFAYAAPELLLGEPCDQQADIYSFGVIMWEVVTHEVPVRGALRAINVPQEGPQQVVDLIKRCLQRRPEARPSARDVFDALSRMVPAPGCGLPTVLEIAETQQSIDDIAAGPPSILDSNSFKVSPSVAEQTHLQPMPAPLLAAEQDAAAPLVSNETATISTVSTGPRAPPGAGVRQLRSI